MDFPSWFGRVRSVLLERGMAWEEARRVRSNALLPLYASGYSPERAAHRVLRVHQQQEA